MFLFSDLFHQRPDKVAALDLGSNSFHMIIAQRDGETWQIIDRLKEPVRLGFGLDKDGNLSSEACQRALDCLARFGQRISDFPRGAVKAVGTKTLRDAGDADAFLKQAQHALGHRIEIISGGEEARLIYLGVIHGLASIEGCRLVCDIGGGSTELIIGNDRQVRFKESLTMGCVMLTQQFFNDGKIDKKRVKKASTYCAQQIEPVLSSLRAQRWSSVLGASGTIKAAAKVCHAQGWADEGYISQQGLAKIIRHGIDAASIDNLQLKGLNSDRKPVFYAGVIVLNAIFEALAIDTMQPSPMALREGLLYEYLGRLDDTDVRDAAVAQLSQRFHVDQDHAQQVAKSAIALWQQVAKAWGIDDPEAKRWLGWAAQLFEIGLDINHAGFHKHSAYIIANSDLAGFSQQEQQALAAVVQAARKKLSLKSLPQVEQAPDGLAALTVILRLALALNRARNPSEQHEPSLEGDLQAFTLGFEQDVLEQYPLLAADLASEAELLADAGIQCTLSNKKGA